MAKVLIADDDVPVLNSISVLLRSLDHEVTAISDSAEAVRVLQEDRFDLLITDIRMTPVDGMQLLQLAQDTHPDMPTIVVSAYSSDAAQEQGYQLGCKAYIKKPFNINEVIDAVEKALAGA